MDMKEASAMTEASRVMNDPDTGDRMSPQDVFSDKASREALLRTTDLLRKVTLAVPLSSLAVAFMVGVLVARRH
jgi:hypothetical protein